MASSERMESKVLRQLKRALQPVLKQPSVEWGQLSVDRQTPQPLPSIFDGERLLVYAFLNNETSKIDSLLPSNEVVLKATTDKEGQEEVIYRVRMDEGKANISVKYGKTIHRLAARSIIRFRSPSLTHCALVMAV